MRTIRQQTRSAIGTVFCKTRSTPRVFTLATAGSTNRASGPAILSAGDSAIRASSRRQRTSRTIRLRFMSPIPAIWPGKKPFRSFSQSRMGKPTMKSAALRHLQRQNACSRKNSKHFTSSLIWHKLRALMKPKTVFICMQGNTRCIWAIALAEVFGWQSLAVSLFVARRIGSSGANV